jgi:FkbM family methyltransferase
MHAYGDILENELFWAGFGGSWEKVAVEVWRRLSETSNGHILDIGANTGAYSLISRACNRHASIIAFEPVARTAQRLERNVELNRFDILVERKAVTERGGVITLYDAPGGNNYTASLEAGHGDNSTSYPVDATSIDEYLRERGWPQVGLIKLDVETHEPAAMRGMAETVRRSRPAILVEVLNVEAGREIAQTIAGLGYLLFNIDEDQGLIPTDTLKPLHGESWNNLICTQEQFEAAGLQALLARRSVGEGAPARP